MDIISKSKELLNRGDMNQNDVVTKTSVGLPMISRYRKHLYLQFRAVKTPLVQNKPPFTDWNIVFLTESVRT